MSSGDEQRLPFRPTSAPSEATRSLLSAFGDGSMRYVLDRYLEQMTPASSILQTALGTGLAERNHSALMEAIGGADVGRSILAHAIPTDLAARSASAALAQAIPAGFTERLAAAALDALPRTSLLEQYAASGRWLTTQQSVASILERANASIPVPSLQGYLTLQRILDDGVFTPTELEEAAEAIGTTPATTEALDHAAEVLAVEGALTEPLHGMTVARARQVFVLGTCVAAVAFALVLIDSRDPRVAALGALLLSLVVSEVPKRANQVWEALEPPPDPDETARVDDQRP